MTELPVPSGNINLCNICLQVVTTDLFVGFPLSGHGITMVYVSLDRLISLKFKRLLLCCEDQVDYFFIFLGGGKHF